MKTLLLLTITLAAFASLASAKPLNLTWTDNSNNEETFAIERSTDGETFEEIAVVPTDTTAYSDATVEIGVEYFYRVRAANQYGYSGYTNIASGKASGGGAGKIVYPGGQLLLGF